MVGGAGNFMNNKLYAQDPRLMSRTRGEYLLLHGDGSRTRQVIHTLRGPENPRRLTANYRDGLLLTTVRTFLDSHSVHAGEDYYYNEDTIFGVDWTGSYCCTTGNVTGVTVPLLAMGMTNGWEFASVEGIAERAASADKTVAFVTGDGALGKGNYHETFTMASLFQLPILFVIRSNGWAMSTPVERSVAFRCMADMARAYQIPFESVDGNDVLAVRNTVRQAAEAVRAGGGPGIIEARTYRMAAHSSNDEDDYRPAEVKKHWAAKDPLTVMESIMKQFGVPQEEADAIKNDAIARVDAAFERCRDYSMADVGQVIEQMRATVDHMWGRE